MHVQQIAPVAEAGLEGFDSESRSLPSDRAFAVLAECRVVAFALLALESTHDEDQGDWLPDAMIALNAAARPFGLGTPPNAAMRNPVPEVLEQRSGLPVSPGAWRTRLPIQYFLWATRKLRNTGLVAPDAAPVCRRGADVERENGIVGESREFRCKGLHEGGFGLCNRMVRVFRLTNLVVCLTQEHACH